MGMHLEDDDGSIFERRPGVYLEQKAGVYLEGETVTVFGRRLGMCWSETGGNVFEREC